MEAVKQYVLSVTAAAIVVGVLASLTEKMGTAGTMVRLLGGLFLALTAISPVVKLDFSNLDRFAYSYSADAESAAACGEAMAEEKYHSIIKAEVESYILDKAALYEVDLQAEVTLDESGLPVGAVLRGAAAPYARQQLTKLLEEELGIAEEDQTWIG